MDKERSGERMKLGAFFHPTGNHVAVVVSSSPEVVPSHARFLLIAQ
jgi:hypothetical protein